MEPISIFSLLVVGGLLLTSVITSSRKKQPNLSAIPSFHWKVGQSLRAKDRFFHDARGILMDAYRKLGNKVYKLSTPDGELVLIPISAATAIKSLPKNTFEFQAASNELLAAEYLTIDHAPEWGLEAIRKDLTQKIAKLAPELDDEMRHIIQADMPSAKEWTAIAVHPKMLRIIAQLSGRIFVGPQVNRNEEWIKQAIGFTMDVFQGSVMIKSLHPAFRPIAQYFLPQVRRIHEHHTKAYRLLAPIFRSRARAEDKPGYQRPDDAIEWLKERSAKDNLDKDFQVHASGMLQLSMASMHTSAHAVTQPIFDLAARPEYLDPLREEVLRVFHEEGGKFTKRGVMNMRKLDSFMKESLRLNPLVIVSFLHKALKPVPLPDGTILPAGTLFAVPNCVLDEVEGIWSNPKEFDGFRYYNLRNSSAEESSRHQLSECSSDAMTFGYGAHTCPGRFFASYMDKLIMAQLIQNFDIELKDKEKGRPPNIKFELRIISDPTAEVIFKRRA